MKKNLVKGILATLLLITISFEVLSFLVRSGTIEIDATEYVAHIQDGDTFQTLSGHWIRLADIDAPERWEIGYDEATDVLSRLIRNKRVYLDIDDISVYDPYGRLVCLVYVDHDSTHYLNVNRALITEGVAYVDNYTNNEFNPYEWTLLVSKRSFIRMLGFSVGFGFVTTLLIYKISSRAWNYITDYIREQNRER